MTEDNRINCPFCNMPIKLEFEHCPFCKKKLEKPGNLFGEDMPDVFKDLFGNFNKDKK